MIGSFAGIQFKVSDDVLRTFRNLTRTTSARFANHEVIGVKPKKEYLGPGLKTGSFSIDLIAYLGVDPMTAINKLDRYVESGRDSPFILGGRNLGRFVILTKSEEYGMITNRGKVISCTVDVEMEEYQ